jgi:hypothetical protein
VNIVNSNSKQLSIPEIIIRFVADRKEKGGVPDNVPLEAVVMSIVQEGAMANTEVEQYGNTAFITHFDEGKTEAAMRAFNVDTAQNYVKNAIAYGEALQEVGVKRLTTDFEDPKILQVLKAVASRMKDDDWGMRIVRVGDSGDMRAYIIFGDSK